MLHKTSHILLFLLFTTLVVGAQSLDTVRKAPIIINQDGNKVSLSADTPPLIQIAGAPEAFYTYFWEFGDGQFSKEESPQHTYAIRGDYDVRVQVTNNYDNGKPPPSRPRTISINETAQGEPTAYAGSDFEGFSMLKSREPVPQQEMVVVMQYANAHTYTTNGKLHLYYNEQKFRADNFEIVDVRTHHGEEQVEDMLLSGLFQHDMPDFQWASGANGRGISYYNYLAPDSSQREHLYITIDESEQQYRDKFTLKFKDMAPGEKRNVFFTVKTTPEMIQDTSAIIKMRGVFVPDERSESHRVQDLEMEIVTSHDPNKMAVNDTRINYRFRKNKKLKYRVRFQNNGEGPATTIRLNVDMPSIIDKSTLEVLDMHPKCVICPDYEVSYSCLDTVLMEDKISFIFKNIYLPGSNQKGVNEYDSTRGFVQYRVKLHKKAPKINSTSRTAIIFDKNEPILTNYAKTYFKPGLSLGAMAGYSAIGDLQNSKNYFLGVTVSPYMPHRGYLQAELLAGFGSYTRIEQFEERVPFGNGTDLNELKQTTEDGEYDYLNLTLVPVSYRYNVNPFLGVGAGVQVSAKLYEKVDKQVEARYFIEGPNGTLEPNPDRNESELVSESEGFTDFNPGVFAGVNLGSSRIGPSAGVRYVRQLNEPYSQWVFYLTWKF